MTEYQYIDCAIKIIGILLGIISLALVVWGFTSFRRLGKEYKYKFNNDFILDIVKLMGEAKNTNRDIVSIINSQKANMVSIDHELEKIKSIFDTKRHISKLCGLDKICIKILDDVHSHMGLVRNELMGKDTTHSAEPNNFDKFINNRIIELLKNKTI